MLAIFKREFRSYFQSVIGWLFVAVVLALYGLYFFVYNLNGGYPYISYALSSISFILLIAVPVLTMRSFSEEQKNKTDQLILTAPISVTKIVIGKYLAMVAVYTIDMLLIGITPLVLSIFGEIPLGESYVAIFGFWLYGCAFIAVGMFISSITESQVIAAVLSFGALFLGYMMSGIVGLFSAENIITMILESYDLYTPLSTFMNGCLDLTGVAYFGSIIFLFVFLTSQSIQKRRWSMSKNKLSLGVFSTGFIAVALIVTIVLNLVVQELPATITAIDATATQIYSITDDTKEYLKGLEQDVTIYVLGEEGSTDTTVDETLERYEGLSEHIKVEYKSITKYPTFYQQYTDETPNSNSLIVVSDERSKVIDYSDIYIYSYDYTYYTTSIEGYDAEGLITSAIQYVTMDTSELPVIYEVTGHDEMTLSGGFTEVLEKANMVLEELMLLEHESVPEDAAALIINAPASDFSSDDAQKVLDYMAAGGKVLAIVDFQYPDLENFESILSAYGVTVIDGLVMDNDYGYSYQGAPYYLLPEVEYSDYTTSLTNSYIFAPYSVGFTYIEEGEEETQAEETTETVSEITYTTLLSTSDDSVSKADLDNFATYEYEEGDAKGPFAVALAVEQEAEEDTTKLVLIGSLQLLTDSADEIVSGNNASLFKQILSELVGDTDVATSVIAAKEYSLSTITVSTGAAIGVALGTIIIIPLLMIVSGVIIWIRRRKQ